MLTLDVNEKTYHGKTDVGFLERRTVIRAIPGDGDDFSTGVESTVDDPLHKVVFVCGGRPGQHPQTWPHFVEQRLVNLSKKYF